MPMHWGLLVVLLGLALGGFLVWRSRHAGSSTQRQSVVDPQHRLGELAQERDRLFARLRSADLTQRDRKDLELAAARVLREMESLDARPSEEATDAAETDEMPEVQQQASDQVPRRSAWTGFAWGVGISLVVIFLSILAGRSSSDRQQGQPMTGGDSVVGGQTPIEGGFDHPDSEVSEEIEEQLRELESRWTEQQDIVALKELTLANVGLERFMEAFRWSQEILDRQPADPDGHYAQGVVRMAMGQSQAAIDHFDRVLAGFPNHVLALVAKGATLKGAGRIQEARGAWEMALLVAGGSHPQIEQLLAELDHPPAPDDAAPLAQQSGQPQADPRGGYLLRLSCKGTNLANHLYVIVRAGPGPPIAAKRLDQPSLPQEVVITAADSMAGGELPPSATVVVRWDDDGNAMTNEGIGEIGHRVALGESADFALCTTS